MTYGRHFDQMLGRFFITAFVTSVAGASGRGITRLTLHRQKIPLKDNAAHNAIREDWLGAQVHGSLPALSLTAEMKDHIYDFSGMLYCLRAKIGTPPRSVGLILDTGSSDLWVKSSYDMNQSSSANVFGGPLEGNVLLEYGKGVVSGGQIEDKVCLGIFCITNQTLVAATSVREIGNDKFYDGVLGLGGDGLYHEFRGNSFLRNFVLSGTFTHPGFTLSLGVGGDYGFISFGNISDLEAEAKSMISASGHTLHVVSGALTYWDVRGQFWTQDASLFGKEAELNQTEGKASKLTRSPSTFILDSGSSFLALPTLEYNRVLTSLLGNNRQDCNFDLQHTQMVICFCDVPTNVLVFEFPSVEGLLHVELTSDDLLIYAGRDATGRAVCSLALQSSFKWILGDVFLRRVHVVHNPKEGRVVLFPRPRVSTGTRQVPIWVSGGQAEARSLIFCSAPHAACAALLAALLAVSALLQWRRCRNEDPNAFVELPA